MSTRLHLRILVPLDCLPHRSGILADPPNPPLLNQRPHNPGRNPRRCGGSRGRVRKGRVQGQANAGHQKFCAAVEQRLREVHPYTGMSYIDLLESDCPFYVDEHGVDIWHKGPANDVCDDKRGVGARSPK